MRNKIYMLCMQIGMLLFIGINTSIVHAEEPFLGEVRWFAGNFAPRGWAKCDGQLLAVNSNQALFSLLGTMHGGDGRTTFGLPDMRGRGMIHAGNGPGLSLRNIGNKSGSEEEALSVVTSPSHSHTLRAESSNGDSVLPHDRVISKVGRLRVYEPTSSVDMGSTSIAASGGGQAHNNVQPHIALTCIIALQGIYPSRN